MLPVINPLALYTQAQAPLVNTITPGTAITHVPYDNVAPSVSSAVVDNNARGNSGAPLPTPEQTAEAESADENFTYPAIKSPIASPGYQATFLAQLIAQDSSPAATGMLVQYEKLIVFANVKYKPSNAMKPQPSPIGVFGRLLHQEHPAPAEPAHEASVVKEEKPAPPANDNQYVAVSAPRNYPAAPAEKPAVSEVA